MEYNVLDEKTVQSEDLVLNQDGKDDLQSGRKWALFILILGYISCGFLVLAALVMFVMGSTMNSTLGFNGGLIGLLYLVIGGIYVIPLIYLTKFIQKSALACNQNDSNALGLAIKNLKMTFKSIGIMTIVLIGLYIVFAIVLGVMAVSGAF